MSKTVTSNTTTTAAATGDAALVRPTEAQLRWAQFHHRRRAIGVRERIHCFLETPVGVEDVPGALPEDGNSTTTISGGDSGNEQRKRRRRRPKVSKGRRALLRVSRRAYEHRRGEIAQDGFQGILQPTNVEDNKQGDEDEEMEEALNDIFMVSNSQRRRQRRRRQNRNNETFKNFRAACHAMMMNLQAPPKHSIVIPTRVWTRSVDPAAALDDEYLDPKWGIRRRPHLEGPAEQHPNAGHYPNPVMPMDRGASWMMHLPKALSVARENPYYHETPLMMPPTNATPAGSLIYDDTMSQHSTSTLALQAPGQKKFNQLLSLVQQRMIQKHKEDSELEGPMNINDAAPTPRMTLRQNFGADEKTPEERISHGEPTRHRPGIVKERKANYVPRMHQKDFVPDGEEQTTEYPSIDGDMDEDQQGVRKMRLRASLAGTQPEKATPRLSRAQELAKSFEAPNKEENRRLSKTQEMARSLEGDVVGKQKHPTMRLRPSLDLEEESEREEKKVPDVPPRRQPHRKSELFEGQNDSPDTDGDHMEPLQDPPQRQPHRLSERMLQAIDESQSHTSRQRVVKPLPPGTCCSRCAQPSPQASSNKQENNLSRPESADTFFAQVRQMNASATSGTSRVSGFLSKFKGPSDAEAKRQSTESQGANPVSNFFSKVRNRTSATPSELNDIDSGRESEFFSQVREMIMETEDDEETANQRVSDFFEEMRKMNAELESQEETDDAECLLCEQCQHHELENQVDPLHAMDSRDVASATQPRLSEPPTTRNIANAATPGRASWHDSMGSHDQEDAKSDHSAISELWNRGRSSLNTFASKLNAISEKSGKPSDMNDEKNKGIAGKSSNKMSDRVGGFFQRLQQKETSTTEPMEASTQVIHIPSVESPPATTEPELEYNSDNDFEAMAAYRKSQEFKRDSLDTTEEASSNSSFRVLPEGIREVVKQAASPSTPSRPSESSLPLPSPSSVPAGMSYLRMSESQTPYNGTPDRMSSSHDRSPAAFSLSRLSAGSPSRSSRASHSVFDNPETAREVQNKFLQNSPNFHNFSQDIIDTDATTSDASGAGMDPHLLSSLMLSPDLLMQRLHQAIRAVEERQWEQVKYLLSANPWLAEMCELTTNQYLLHKLAFFGAGTSPAPIEICQQLMDMFPAAVHKFDQDGNVPLHLSAAAGHLKMIHMLGEEFKSGASIRNEDGMLPLHFAIASYGDHAGDYADQEDTDDHPSPLRVIKTVLSFFPTAVAIADNDGNLPVHVAAECLKGGVGVDIIYLLLDEADRQLQDPMGARFYNKLKLEEIVNEDIVSSKMSTAHDMMSDIEESDTQCTMVKNEFGETPLLAAVRAFKGWEMVEALATAPGGSDAALLEDADKNNALHLLVGDFQDPAAAMSILKVAPATAMKRNAEGMLPIEVACLQLMPEEVILSIALVDLPIDIDDKDALQSRDGYGGSWWFLACECDDVHVGIVQGIVSICSFEQIRELCFMKGGSTQHDGAVISRATPKCRDVLTQALRFLGRFEFVGNNALRTDPNLGLQEFDALDFGDDVAGDEGRRMVLRCYSIKDAFLSETAIVRDIPLDPVYVEEALLFGGDDTGTHPAAIEQQYCLAIESHQITLNSVVDGMLRKGGYKNDQRLRQKYAAKMCAVLRLIAKALRHLHTAGVVHGDVCMEQCGKFEHSWKLLGRTGVRRIGDPFDTSRFSESFPPEALVLDEQEGTIYNSDDAPISFRSLKADPSVDIWAFGKLAYETLVGKPLVEFDADKKTFEDVVALLEIVEWDESNMKTTFTDLLSCGATESCASLVTSCLFPTPEDRPKSMDVILEDGFWKDMRQYRDRSKSTRRRGGESGSVYTDSSPKSIFTETSSAVDVSHEVETAEI